MPDSVLERHPSGVGLGMFDVGCDHGCGLFSCVTGWFSPCPALVESSSSGTPVPAPSFHWLPLPLTPEDAPVGVSSKESLTKKGQVSGVHPQRTELGKVGSWKELQGDEGGVVAAHRTR